VHKITADRLLSISSLGNVIVDSAAGSRRQRVLGL
jgi:hypothetical protein